MSPAAIVNKLWGSCNVLYDDGTGVRGTHIYSGLLSV